MYENNSTPTVGDYVKWMLFPTLLGLVTCGIGSLILMIVWACDNKKPARANYFRALFIITAIGIALSLIMGVLFSATIAGMVSSAYNTITI